MRTNEQLVERLRKLTMLVMDVDGVLTDGAVVYDTHGGEQKRFHVSDGLGLVVLQQCEVIVAWISGRASRVVERRAEELGVRYLLQGVRDKEYALTSLCAQLNQELHNVGYIGDDWNDLPALEIVGTRIAVANAAQALIDRAHYVTHHPGGSGAVREVCELIIAAKDQEEEVLRRYIDSLKNSPSSVPENRHSAEPAIGSRPLRIGGESDDFARGAEQ